MQIRNKEFTIQVSETITPYKETALGKKQQVTLMFNRIAGHYDFMNHFLSMNIDKIWRRKTIRLLTSYKPKKILDVATGTGDLAIESMKLNPDKIIGIDISEQMLEIGRKKISKKKLTHKIELHKDDSESLSFSDNSFDAVTVAFGVRNFENLEKGLTEMKRVLLPEGKIVILEFSKPKFFPVKQLYDFYFFNILPFIGKVFFKSNREYAYLPQSVKAFPDEKEFISILQKTGFKNIIPISLSMGICTIYFGEK